MLPINEYVEQNQIENNTASNKKLEHLNKNYFSSEEDNIDYEPIDELDQERFYKDLEYSCNVESTQSKSEKDIEYKAQPEYKTESGNNMFVKKPEKKFKKKLNSDENIYKKQFQKMRKPDFSKIIYDPHIDFEVDLAMRLKLILGSERNFEEKNLSISLSNSIIEDDQADKNFNYLKEKIREITDNFVVVHPLKKMEDFEELNRNYFRLININAPVRRRFENFSIKHADKLNIEFSNNKLRFINFMEEEENFYLQNSDIKEIQNLANYHISNDGTLEDFYKKLDMLATTLHQTFRPNWDDYFMKITHAVSERSNCMKQRIGAIIVKDFRIISTGYNGMSSSLGNCYLGNCPRCNIKTRQGENLHNCICVHAEESAVIYNY